VLGQGSDQRDKDGSRYSGGEQAIAAVSSALIVAARRVRVAGAVGRRIWPVS